MERYQRVESAGIGHAFETLAVDDRIVYALHEVVYVLELAAALALLDDRLRGGIAHTLDRGQTEAHVAGLVGRKVAHRLVDVGAEHAYAHVLALVHVCRDLLDVVKVATQHGSHILRGVVRFEVGRLVCDPRVARSVRFVEGIRGELLPVGPYLLQHLLVVAVGLASRDEFRFQLVQLRLDLLTHCLSQRVRLAAREAAQQSRQKHDLLLIYRNAVGIFEILLHFGYVVHDRLAAVLAVDEVGYVVHRTGTVERIHRYQVLECRGLQLAKILLHAR
ncbi:hypothetical protein IMSAGC022_00975 [Alistipes sp.]|nr:hypothetical protein IMSAGC022_00975 [Alistipes sp.]